MNKIRNIPCPILRAKFNMSLEVVVEFSGLTDKPKRIICNGFDEASGCCLYTAPANPEEKYQPCVYKTGWKRLK